MKTFSGERIYLDVDGDLELIGQIDNSCDWGTLWRFYSERTELIYVLGRYLTEDQAIKLAIRLDKHLTRNGH